MEFDESGRPVPPISDEPPPELFDELPPEAYYGDPSFVFSTPFTGEPPPGEPRMAGPEVRPPRVDPTPPRQVLRDVFGYDSFRPLQREVVDSILALRDTLAIMPTGGGKSLCYQLPALLFDGVTIVVSPLISLMQDQVRQLEALGVPTAVLNSTLDWRQYRANRRSVLEGRAKLLYLAPETLFLDKTRRLLEQTQVSCLTIDEAHCISEWGHDFRPEYRRLTEIRAAFPKAVCVGLTATATPRVRDDIAATLGFSDDARFVASFDRPNLVLRVQEKDRPLEQVLAFLKRTEGSGIIYCGTRRGVEQLAERLSKRGLRVRPYHAGLADQQRRENQERFIRDDVDLIVATVAFGMGINKPDVRFVVHRDMPKSVEAYYQQIGRAGRDGLPAECLLLFGGEDLAKAEFFISQKSSDQEQRVGRLQLSRMQAFAEATMCRRQPLLAYFGEEREADGCGACDNCIAPQPDLRDLTVEAQKFLSCVYRTGQRFGISHIVDVLRGSQAQKVVRAGHDRLSTHGIGKEHDGTQWRHIARQLIQQKLLVQDPNYGGLELTAGATEVLRGGAKVEGRLRKAAKKTKGARSGRKRGARGGGADLDIDYDLRLFEALRATRKRLADDAGVPPYVVFPDRTLMEMAASQPRTDEELHGLHGVGAVKLARHGRAFLEAIDVWCAEHGLADAPSRPAVAPPRPAFSPQAAPPPTAEAPIVNSATESRRERLVEGIAQGQSLAELGARENIRADTVVAHLERWIQAGHELDATALAEASDVPAGDLRAAIERFDELGAERLKPTWEALGGRVDWPALRVARLVWYLERR